MTFLHSTEWVAGIILLNYFYFFISYIWWGGGGWSGHWGVPLSELQILPYLTNQAFDVGCDRWLLQSGCQVWARVRSRLLFQSHRKK